VFEHITTREAAQYVQQAPGPIAATITAHHLLYERNALFKGGMRPHWYCLPVLKREDAPPRAARGRDRRQPALLPRHRQRAACART
jgi:dihydroorotase